MRSPLRGRPFDLGTGFCAVGLIGEPVLNLAFIPSAGIRSGKLPSRKVPMTNPIGKSYAIANDPAINEIAKPQTLHHGDFSRLRPGAPFLGVLPYRVDRVPFDRTFAGLGS